MITADINCIYSISLYIDTDISDTNSVHNSVTKWVKSSGTEGLFKLDVTKKKGVSQRQQTGENTDLISLPEPRGAEDNGGSTGGRTEERFGDSSL